MGMKVETADKESEKRAFAPAAMLYDEANR
jgi:hypothetical protein